jgi:hypothetical protein
MIEIPLRDQPEVPLDVDVAGAVVTHTNKYPSVDLEQ